MPITTLTPDETRAAIDAGATLIDIRNPDEYARERIAGAINVPLDRIGAADLPSGPLIFHCRTGMRTNASASLLESAAQSAPCHLLDGGIEGWRAGGNATIINRRQPLEIMRQVQLGAGGLVLLGVLFGWFISPAFFVVSAFVGVGLMLAGATGWCGMAHLLRRMPWNRAAA